MVGLFGHEVDAELPQDDHGEPEQSDGHGAVGQKRGPECPTIAQHPREDEKHRQGWQYEPEGAFGVIGDARGGLLLLVHPDHRDQRGKGQRDEQRRKPIIEKLHFIDDDNDDRCDQDFHQVESGKLKQLLQRFFVHKDVIFRAAIRLLLWRNR